jgi:hypothetical protein
MCCHRLVLGAALSARTTSPYDSRKCAHVDLLRLACSHVCTAGDSVQHPQKFANACQSSVYEPLNFASTSAIGQDGEGRAEVFARKQACEQPRIAT